MEITDPCDFEQLGRGQAYRFSDFPGEHKKTPAISLWEPQGMMDAEKISWNLRFLEDFPEQNCAKLYVTKWSVDISSS